MQTLSPTEIRELCERYGLKPSKQYGQNYLISAGVVEKIILAASISKTDTIFEIGPGFGVLTLPMAQKAGKVVVFEIEKKLEDFWLEKIAENKNIEIVWGNALKSLTAYSLKAKNYKVVANIPYQITSQLLRLILESENKPESMTVMVQKEVAERICAEPGNMSLLAVSVQYYGEPKIVAKVTKGNFWPEPKVDSAVLQIEIKKNEVRNSERDEKFFRLVRVGFSSKRKQLWHNLCSGLKIEAPKVKNILQSVVGNEKVRAQELSVYDWIRLVDCLTP